MQLHRRNCIGRRVFIPSPRPMATSTTNPDAGLRLERSVAIKSDGYLVPCVWKAIQTLEILRNAPGGLCVSDLVTMTGYARGTIYRILRTTTKCGYTIHEHKGLYLMNYAYISPTHARTDRSSEIRGDVCDEQAAQGGLVFERWGVRFHADGRRCKCTSAAGVVKCD